MGIYATTGFYVPPPPGIHYVYAKPPAFLAMPNLPAPAMYPPPASMPLRAPFAQPMPVMPRPPLPPTRPFNAGPPPKPNQPRPAFYRQMQPAVYPQPQWPAIPATRLTPGPDRLPVSPRVSPYSPPEKFQSTTEKHLGNYVASFFRGVGITVLPALLVGAWTIVSQPRMALTQFKNNAPAILLTTGLGGLVSMGWTLQHDMRQYLDKKKQQVDFSQLPLKLPDLLNTQG